ncbi:MAG: sulfatase-like hydrolase/transferase [Phycisphaerae bacterium]|nr:sulfatase-like hydrolase/transferase [Phycisphaerae bacterium]
MTSMSRRNFLKGLGVGIAAMSLRKSSSFADEPNDKPNIVFFLADDLGWRDTSLYGSTFYETPNIDALAKRGMMFTNAYAANPLCSPTRASILTGQYPARIGITSPACHLQQVVLDKSLQDKASPRSKWLVANSLTRLKRTFHTLAEALIDVGYITGHFGKWHLGPEPYSPRHHGFDVDFPRWHGPGPPSQYLAPWRLSPKMTIKQGEKGDHIEDLVATKAIAFIRANKGRPFFVNYWAFSVHAPHEAKPQLEQKYKAKASPEDPQRQPVNAGMIETLDANVGRITKTIDELGLTDNTIIVFFSDNGGIHWPSKQCYPDVPVTSNSPLRGGKATIYEGGTREPCIIIWPGVVRPGSTSEQIISSIDFYPTILEMIRARPKPGQNFDGISIVPALNGRRLARDTIFCHFPHGPANREGFQPSTYVRKGDWKLIRFYADGPDQTDRYELYNLADDIGEKNDLAKEYPQKVKELDAMIDRFLEDTQAVVPKANPAYDPKAKPPPPARKNLAS